MEPCTGGGGGADMVLLGYVSLLLFEVATQNAVFDPKWVFSSASEITQAALSSWAFSSRLVWERWTHLYFDTLAYQSSKNDLPFSIFLEHRRKMKRKVIIDCDPGIDDALAILLAIASPELEIIAISVSSVPIPDCPWQL